MPTSQKYTIDITDSVDVRNKLNVVPWGRVDFGGGTTMLICPLCQAVTASMFNNAHELAADDTPKNAHISYHVSMIEMAINKKRDSTT